MFSLDYFIFSNFYSMHNIFHNSMCLNHVRISGRKTSCLKKKQESKFYCPEHAELLNYSSSIQKHRLTKFTSNSQQIFRMKVFTKS